MKINVKEARRRFSELLNRAEHGEDVVVTRRGKSAVRLVVAVKGQPRHPLPDLS
ncbi:MAG TPA: type II toxin-antitoxin system prevent-host-death family antitoxin, partial [Acidiferrobacteraceae bacterium]|nr:type II toxin-antitoxin system prevent-host-death family antitoxin [Acidiferrobacteraceae bacterium]